MSLDEPCRGELSRLILRRVVWQFKMSFPKKVNKTCHFCAINVLSGEGNVPLFKPTKNKEFCGKSFCKTGTVILSDLIKRVRIDIDSTSESDSSAKNVQGKLSIVVLCFMSWKKDLCQRSFLRAKQITMNVAVVEINVFTVRIIYQAG